MHSSKKIVFMIICLLPLPKRQFDQRNIKLLLTSSKFYILKLYFSTYFDIWLYIKIWYFCYRSTLLVTLMLISLSHKRCSVYGTDVSVLSVITTKWCQSTFSNNNNINNNKKKKKNRFKVCSQAVQRWAATNIAH